jgi:hypothetical protein
MDQGVTGEFAPSFVMIVEPRPAYRKEESEPIHLTGSVTRIRRRGIGLVNSRIFRFPVTMDV